MSSNVLSKRLKEKLEKIAIRSCYSIRKRGGLNLNNNDDLIEVSVFGLQKMLHNAYNLGKKDAKEYFLKKIKGKL